MIRLSTETRVAERAGHLHPFQRPPPSLTLTPSAWLDQSNEPVQLVSPMKAFLLAAGHGTRLRPLTDSVPKCLLPVRGVPILQIWLEICRRLGIDQVLVNLHAHANAVRAFVDKESKDINVDESSYRVGMSMKVDKHLVYAEAAAYLQ